MRLVVRSLAPSLNGLLALHLRGSLRRRLPVHGRLLVARRRRRVGAGLLVGLLVGIALLTVGRKRLAVGTVQLSVGWRLLAAPDGVSGYESLGLGRHRGEDTFLREALAVGAAAVLRLVEARAADLKPVSEVVLCASALQRGRARWFAPLAYRVACP